MCSFAATNAKEKDRHSLTSVFASILLTVSTQSANHSALSSATERSPGQPHRVNTSTVPATILEGNLYTAQGLIRDQSGRFRVADDANSDLPIFEVPSSSVKRGSEHAVYKVLVLHDANTNAKGLEACAAKEPWSVSNEQVCRAEVTDKNNARCTIQV